VRLHAGKWHIDPHKIGVLGFSAGGHMVIAISARFGKRLYSPVDANMVRAGTELMIPD